MCDCGGVNRMHRSIAVSCAISHSHCYGHLTYLTFLLTRVHFLQIPAFHFCGKHLCGFHLQLNEGQSLYCAHESMAWR
ncbi:hypothetical protein STEG23_036021 [Scotinomys teguina]